MTDKYQNAKIYKLTGGGLTYFGSTTRKYLCQRLSEHKKLTNKGSSRQIVGFPDCEITLIETFPCQSKDELRARERYWIENNECINKNIPGRTKAEWYQANPNYFKNWNSANREHRREYCAEWRQRKKSEKQTTNTQPDEIPSSPL